MTPDLTRFKNPALHFSGGKDSLACLYLLRPCIDGITVYWLNTGDGCPETLEIIRQVREWVPKFVEVKTDSKAWRAQHGQPSDLVPAGSHWLGRAYGLESTPISARFDCCFHNLMEPMHARMLEDGVDAVIRGTKLADTGRVPAVGKTTFYEVLLPLLDWSHEQVFDYLASEGAPANAIYKFSAGASAPECFSCTAWWDDGKAAYFKAAHPDRLGEYRVSLKTIKQALMAHLENLDREITQ